MFERKTVFVVGAGGSQEVGLPTGYDLKLRIGDALRVVPNSYEFVNEEYGFGFALHLMHRLSGEKTDIRGYYDAARAISEAMPLAISIDNFLHTHAHDDKIITMGKMAIAALILEAERNSKLYVDPHRDGKIDFRTLEETWHSTFVKMALEGLQKGSAETAFDNISIITFNYDRCIEHYVAQALSAYLRIDIDEARQLTSRLTVIHPYGQVGALPWQKAPETFATHYGLKPSTESLASVWNEIQTFTEQARDADLITKMHQTLVDAERVIYLGFSFLPINMQLMSFNRAVDKKRVWGTSIGLSNPNQQAAEKAIKNSMGPADAVLVCSLQAVRCNQLLNDNWRDIVD